MESPPSERTYAACAINIARVFAHYISYPPPPPPPLNRDINLPHHPPWPTTVNRPSTSPANALARCYYVLQPSCFNRAHALCTPTTHATAILIHHDHCLLCRSPKTPPCPSPCHFSSPPQAITTSPLPVPPPLPPPSPPATISTRHQLYQRHLYAIATPPTPRTPPPSPPFGLPPPLRAAAIDHFHHRRQIHQHAASAR